MKSVKTQKKIYRPCLLQSQLWKHTKKNSNNNENNSRNIFHTILLPISNNRKYHLFSFLLGLWTCKSLSSVFLAHLSRRLKGELIVYPWSGVRPSSVVHIFKHLLLWNRLANQSQILCGASLGRGNESLFAASGSHDQDGRHAHGKNPSKIFFSRTSGPIFTKLGMYHLGLHPIIVCSNDDPGVTLTYFTARSNLVT